MKYLVPLLMAVLFLSGCHPKSYDLEPKIDFVPQEHHVGNLPRTFSPLTKKEQETSWGQEMFMGDRFAKEFDFYRAITCYKRGLMLMPPDVVERRYEISYNIVQAYYLACKYQDAANSFEGSTLVQVPKSFPAFHDLLLIVYDSYMRIGECQKAEILSKSFEKHYPETLQKLKLSYALENGDLCEAKEIAVSDELHDKTVEFIDEYCHCAKSVKKAQWLNAVLPGAGYAYVGQKQSAITSFLINGLFIAGAYQFYQRGYWAAGGIMTTLEFGWYVGGINGAGLEAKEWNQRCYEANARHFMNKNKLFPIFMLETTF